MRLSAHESESALPREGWILYDGGCGFCFRWVHLWKKVVGRRGFGLQDLQSASADGSLQIPQENLLDDIRVLTRSGKLESGANAYLYVARRVWWAWPFYAIFCLPGFNSLGWAIVGSIEIGTESRDILPEAARERFEIPGKKGC
jgi:predicted DCC family thiol-disulfide oxidoreductase YuxK